MDIIKDFIPVGRNNRPAIFMTPKWITVHDTANTNPGADAEAHAAYLKGDAAASRPASWHFTVDGGSKHKDGTVKPPQIYQHLPLRETGWHAGDWNGPGNMTSIGVEICENSDGDRAKAEDGAARLVAWLLWKLGLGLDRVVQHHHWSGKDCPRVLRSRPGGWEEFLAAVDKYKSEGDGMFKDVKTDDWFYRALERMVRLERVAGFPDGTFKPNEPLKRGEYVAGEHAEYQNRFNVIEKVKPAVCVISGPGGTGSGYLVAKDTVVTNVHVALCGANKNGDIRDLTVRFFDGTTVPAKLVQVPWGDGARDCAVLKIPSVGIEPLQFGSPYPGEDVYVIGAPVGMIASVSKGIISHDRRYTETMGVQARWLQVDAAINPGNSGGALVNIYGELIGMPTWKLFLTGETPPRQLEGMGFCLHVDEIRTVLTEAGKIALSEQKIVRLAALDKPFVLVA